MHMNQLSLKQQQTAQTKRKMKNKIKKKSLP